jgi:hypothetical protein
MNSIALCFVNSLDDIINQFLVPQASKAYIGEVVESLKEEIEDKHEPDDYHGETPCVTDSHRKMTFTENDDGSSTIAPGDWTPSYVQSWLSRRLLTTLLGVWTTNFMLTKGYGFLRYNGKCEFLAIGMFMEMWFVLIFFFLIELLTMVFTRQGATRKWTMRQMGRAVTMTGLLLSLAFFCVSVAVFAPYGGEFDRAYRNGEHVNHVVKAVWQDWAEK